MDAPTDAPPPTGGAVSRAAAPARDPGARRRRRIALGALLAGGAGALGVGLVSRTAREAPAVSFTTLDGERIALAGLRGRVVLVNFWATTCTICVAEMPSLADLHRRLAPRGLSTIAVAMPYDRPDFVLHYARRSALPFPVALDPTGVVTQALGPVRGTPTLVVVDRAGRIAHTLEGESDLARLEGVVERLLAAS